MSIYKCQVKHCRFPNTHTTSGHKCGSCDLFGHGVLECNSLSLKQSLIRFYDDTMEPSDYCRVPNCFNPHNHNTQAHHCNKCNRRHAESECIIQSLNHYLSLSHNNVLNNVENILEQVNNCYIIKYAGMGCQFYIRKKNNVIDVLFMHDDSWGQYGNETDHQPILREFIEGLTNHYYDENDFNTNVNADLNPDLNDKTIKCPLCRTDNSLDDIKNIKGYSEKCSVCYENNVNKYFSKCEHACVCSECLVKL